MRTMSERTRERRVYIASGNQHKVDEIAEILSDVVGAQMWGINALGYEPPEENGETFEENALIKARHLWSVGLGATIADDSGLEIDALDGAPGVHSARYAGDHDDEANNALVLERLADVPDEQRTARFVSAIAFVDEAGTEKVVRGTVEGRIAHAPRGENGFGYDPIFRPAGERRSSAELRPEEKNLVSHRTLAFTALAPAIAERARAGEQS